MSPQSKCIGILTAGGDCPGLNAAIRAIAKPALSMGMTVLGINDGFRGLIENRFISLDNKAVSGILTKGGTILGTSRTKIHKVRVGEKIINMTDLAMENIEKNHIDCLVCLGGGGTQKNALRLMKKGINVLTLPKTIDNDVWGTEVTFGYDSALQVATDAIDRLHTTATSHHRIIVCEIMGHKAGWLALSAGIAGGADVILIPEIPYDFDVITSYIKKRRKTGKRFSIIAVAEGAISIEEAQQLEKENQEGKDRSEDNNTYDTLEEAQEELANADDKIVEKRIDGETMTYHLISEPIASKVARNLQERTGIEARVTTLGHVQRGGSPSATDRQLCTLLGTNAIEHIAKKEYNIMIGWKHNTCKGFELEEIAGKRKIVPMDHPLVKAARMVESCLGDK